MTPVNTGDDVNPTPSDPGRIPRSKSVKDNPSTDPSNTSAEHPPHSHNVKKRAPRWLTLGSSIAMIGVSALLLGIVLGWLGRGNLVAAELPLQDTLQVQTTEEPTTVQAQPMPDIRGLSETDARQVIADAGYSPEIITVKSTPSLLPAGTIAAQSPVQGTSNATEIVLSTPAPAIMPELAGNTVDQATEQLARMGASPKILRVYDAKATPGTVLSSDPAKGAPLPAEPTLNVAAIPATVAFSALPATGSCGPATNGSVNGLIFSSGIVCSASDTESTSYWILGRKLARLHGTIGIEDNSDPRSKVTVKIAADGKNVFVADIAYGQSQEVDLDISNILRLDQTIALQDPDKDLQEKPKVVWADATVYGSTQAITSMGLTP